MLTVLFVYLDLVKSPSTWRVWIEICYERTRAKGKGSHPPLGGCGLKFCAGITLCLACGVTLHLEGVD